MRTSPNTFDTSVSQIVDILSTIWNYNFLFTHLYQGFKKKVYLHLEHLVWTNVFCEPSNFNSGLKVLDRLVQVEINLETFWKKVIKWLLTNFNNPQDKPEKYSFFFFFSFSFSLLFIPLFLFIFPFLPLFHLIFFSSIFIYCLHSLFFFFTFLYSPFSVFLFSHFLFSHFLWFIDDISKKTLVAN